MIKITPGKKARYDTLLTYYKVMSVPTLRRVRETWIMKEDNSRLQASEMQFPRSVLAYSRNVFFTQYY